jgi:hypothetical protein
VKTKEWEITLSRRISGALEPLSEIDWEVTLEEIRLAKSSSFMYGITRFVSYYIILALLIAVIPLGIGSRTTVILVSIFATPFIALLTLEGSNMIKRYRVSRSLDFFSKELRSLYSDFKQSEFEIA